MLKNVWQELKTRLELINKQFPSFFYYLSLFVIVFLAASTSTFNKFPKKKRRK